MLIYKYRSCSQQTWEILQNRNLYFALPAQLNDPLDSSIDISAEYERARQIVEESDDHPEARKSFLVFLLNNRSFLEVSTGEKMNLNEALKRFIQSRGILSLSKSATDALLWSHYANGHAGICLGFDPEIFKFERVLLMEEVEYAAKPPYVDLFLKLTEELGDFVRPWEQKSWSAEQGNHFYTSQLARLMRANWLVKSEKWKYEEEYRIITSSPRPPIIPT